MFVCACLPGAEDALDKTIAFLGSGAKAAFTPEHGKAQGPFRVVIGRRDAVFLEKQPQAIHLTLNAAHEQTRFIRLLAVQTDKPDEPFI